MNSLKPLQWIGITLGIAVVLFFSYRYLQLLGNVNFLGAVLLLEVIIACVWKYSQRFFVLLMITFVWASMHLPMQGAWTSGRWLVLGAGAAAGYIVWTKTSLRPFGSFHLIALSCVFTAFVSATVSAYLQMASLKALSLLLLFLYCASGARLAVLGREAQFFRGLMWGCEVAVYGTAFSYFVLGESIWGNPNSLGAAMSIGVFPILLWGWLISDSLGMKTRRMAALLLCTYLVFFSLARAGMVSIVLVTLIFCICLHQYKLLIKVVALAAFGIALAGMVAPGHLDRFIVEMRDSVLYKGHKDEGVLGSRRTPWEDSIASIKQHPFFGTGYGTSPTGVDPGLEFGTVASSAETSREHGSSYMTIAEWVGLMGVLPFVMILSLTMANVWRVCAWMNRNADPRHYSIPLAMVVLCGLLHASFEDWLFAVGSYPCVYFWFFSFVLADLVPARAVEVVPGFVSRAPRMAPAGLDAVLPNR
jgi:O-antigen ligase